MRKTKLILFAGILCLSQMSFAQGRRWEDPYVPIPGDRPPDNRIPIPGYPPDRDRVRFYTCYAIDQDGRRYTGSNRDPSIAMQVAMNLCSIGQNRCTPGSCY